MVHSLDFRISRKNITHQNITKYLESYGICVLENFFPNDFITSLFDESQRLFRDYASNIEVLDKEECSKDERIFDAQNLSKEIKNFAETTIFKSVAKSFRKSLKMKTLLNRIVFEPGVIKNSGAGWHRDNHDCQFKVLLYLSDVDCSKGNLQWITNSSKVHIGYPLPRCSSYNTRFSDQTISEICKRKECEIINITGHKGTLIFANTTYIHRGNIIEAGERIALTQYFF